jgi:F-type H+-transporting ATPase subunit a
MASGEKQKKTLFDVVLWVALPVLIVLLFIAPDSEHHHDPLAAKELIKHVKDDEEFHLPRMVAHGHVEVPQVFDSSKKVGVSIGFEPVDKLIENGGFDFRATKFMVIEVIAAVIICLVFIRLAGKIQSGGPPRGRFWNFFEAMLLFMRDQVARPAIGKHDADQFLPFVWTIFFFILLCNLLGLVPWMGSPTGALAVTGAMAVIVFVAVVVAGSIKLGVVGFWKNQVPHMDLPLPLAIVLVPMIFMIEVLGLFIKHFVLAVRLLANMMAGHLVVAVILAFIAASAGFVWFGVAPASVLGVTAISMLELFVAFLQAYIFAFLASLFIGMAVHSH